MTSRPGGRGGAHGPSGFCGVYQFGGAPDPSNPSVAGGTVISYWSDIEPSDGVFDWSVVETRMAKWTAAGKKVIVRIIPTGSANGQSATPGWLLHSGVPSVTAPDGTVYAQFWNPLYLAKFREMVAAFGARYDGSSSIAFVDAAVGDYGETKVASIGSWGDPGSRLAAWLPVGYSDPTWWAALQQMLSAYSSAFPRTALAVEFGHSTFLQGSAGLTDDTVAAWAVHSGFYLQDDSANRATTYTSSAWSNGPVEEQNQAASSSGYRLSDDLRHMVLDLGARYAMIYGTDLGNQSNAAALAWAASQVTC